MHLLVGFRVEAYDAFRAKGIEIPAWIQVARSRQAMVVPTDVETYWWDDMVTSDLAGVFRSDIDRELVRRVRDRAYPYFIRMQDRVYYSKMRRRGSWLNTVNLMEMMIHFFYDLLVRNGIKYILSSNIPHEGPHIILYFLAQEMGLDNIVATQSLFPNAFWIVRDIRDPGYFKTGIARPHEGFPIVERPEKPFYMNKLPVLSERRYRLFMAATAAKIAFKAPLAAFGLRGRTFRKSVFKFRERAGHYDLHRRQSYDRPVVGDRFVYFPLHLQPEMTTDTLGHEYCDQLLAVEELLKKIPEDIYIYLKENPKQTGRMREPSFIRRLKRMPRVRYLPIETDSLGLISASEGRCHNNRHGRMGGPSDGKARHLFRQRLVSFITRSDQLELRF